MTSYDSDISRGPHRLTVKRWHDQFNCHECMVGGSTQTVFIDLFVDGKMPDSIGPDDLIGEIVEVAYTHGFIWLASEPRIVTDEPPECPSSPNGRHQVDTSMESGPNNCFHCEAPMPDTYRGWNIARGRWPEPAWVAFSPNYDASYEGPEDGWVDNGEKANAPTREALIEEIDAWFEEHGQPSALGEGENA